MINLSFRDGASAPQDKCAKEHNMAHGYKCNIKSASQLHLAAPTTQNKCKHVVSFFVEQHLKISNTKHNVIQIYVGRSKLPVANSQHSYMIFSQNLETWVEIHDQNSKTTKDCNNAKYTV